jgi:hypothetical protein
MHENSAMTVYYGCQGEIWCLELLNEYQELRYQISVYVYYRPPAFILNNF